MKFLFYFFIVLSIIACKREVSTPEPEKSAITLQEKKVFEAGDVYADNQFKGARLNGFEKINDSTFQATISPENTPVNASPWFAFRIWSQHQKTINLVLKYTAHKHRYIPKTSMDGKNWQAMDSLDVEIDTSTQSATLKLDLSPYRLWLAAQEVITSDDINQWISGLEKLPYAQKKVIGKSVLGQALHSLEFSEGKGGKSIVLIGRQHPPEVPGATLSLVSFAEEILSNSELANRFRQSFNIIMIPLLNPDGTDMGHWRHNAKGVDLNRDWQDFTQPETQAVRDYLKKEDKSVAFALDFHTSYSGPYLLVLDTLNEANSPGLIPDWIDKIESEIPGFKLDKRHRSQDLPYCYNWFINEFGIEAVTFEEGDEIDRKVVKERAQIYARTLMETLLESNEE